MLRRSFQAISKSLRLQPDRIHKGQDFMGNNYFEVPPQKYYFGMKEVFKTKRTIETPNMHNIEMQRDVIESGRDVPTEWLAWLQGRRKNPPTEQEVQNNLIRMQNMKEKVQFLDEKHKQEKEPISEAPKPKKKDLDQAEVDSWNPK